MTRIANPLNQPFTQPIVNGTIGEAPSPGGADRLLIRAASLDEIPLIQRFNETYRTDNTIERSEDELAWSVEQGLFLVAESQHRGLVAVSGVFEHAGGRFLEYGAVRVVLNGYGLQRTLCTANMAQIYRRGLGRSTVYCSVLNDNDRSIHNVQKVGFFRWVRPATEILAEPRYRRNFGPGRYPLFFSMPGVVVRKLASRFDGLSHEALLRRWKRNYAEAWPPEFLRVTFDIGLRDPSGETSSSETKQPCSEIYLG